ncbi:tripartite tricarboxylate transporter TctB family protein [Alcaligenes sp. SDU_A2]|uniref:tripartite tricarboxylate transporter TctB family protein n=1 Tax=Alcaligenes sp. SDU_A2 TaxID=3136634 RepID=UPI00311D5F3C
MVKPRINMAFSSAIILISILILSNDSLVSGGVQTELGSLFLPRIIAVLMIALALGIGLPALLGILRHTHATDSDGRAHDAIGVCLYLAILLAYWAGIPWVGFMVATPLAMLAIGWLLGARKFLPLLAISVITPFVIDYGSRTFLRVFLPGWSLG